MVIHDFSRVHNAKGAEDDILRIAQSFGLDIPTEETFYHPFRPSHELVVIHEFSRVHNAKGAEDDILPRAAEQRGSIHQRKEDFIALSAPRANSW